MIIFRVIKIVLWYEMIYEFYILLFVIIGWNLNIYLYMLARFIFWHKKDYGILKLIHLHKQEIFFIANNDLERIDDLMSKIWMAKDFEC